MLVTQLSMLMYKFCQNQDTNIEFEHSISGLYDFYGFALWKLSKAFPFFGLHNHTYPLFNAMNFLQSVRS